MTAERRNLSGMVVAITGASSGIGRETARALAAAGAGTVLMARRGERLDELVDELAPAPALAVVGDVRTAADTTRMVQAALDRFGRLDVLVANAGIGRYGGIMDATDDEVVDMVDTNVLGTIWSIRAAIPAMMPAGGDIVVVASVAGLRGGAHEAVYAATKFAQVGLAGAIDRELRESRIRVSTICPAAVATEFAIGAGRSADDPWLDAVMQPDDVASAIVYTLSQPQHLRTQLWTMWSMAEGS